MELQEFKEEVKVLESEFVDDGDDRDSTLIDLMDSLALLNKAMRLLDYMSDADLCHSITKRERENMSKIAVKIKEFLDEVEIAYMEA